MKHGNTKITGNESPDPKNLDIGESVITNPGYFNYITRKNKENLN
jgi:hypothetical protein